MERFDDSHIPEEALTYYAFHGIPDKRTDVTNHLVACDSCNAIYEDALDQKEALTRARDRAAVSMPRRRSSVFLLPKHVWAAAGVLFLLVFMSPDVQPYTEAAQVVEIAAVRGGQTIQARPQVPLSLRLDATGLDVPPVVQVDIVNERGEHVWRGSARQVGSAWQARTARGLRPGRYWVRIPDPSHPGEYLREFQLDVGQ